MPGVGEGEHRVVEQAYRAVVTDGNKMFHHSVHLLQIVQRFGFGLVELVHLLVVPAYILRLDIGGIRQHDGAQVTRCGRTIYITAKTEFVDVRQQSRVVDMRMAEHDAVQRFGIKTQIAVGGIGLHTFTLIHTAIQ